MSTMTSPADLTISGWKKVVDAGTAVRFVTIQPQGGTIISVFIGTTVPDENSPRINLSDLTGGVRFALEAADVLWLRYRGIARPMTPPALLISSV